MKILKSFSRRKGLLSALIPLLLLFPLFLSGEGFNDDDHTVLLCNFDKENNEIIKDNSLGRIPFDGKIYGNCLYKKGVCGNALFFDGISGAVDFGVAARVFNSIPVRNQPKGTIEFCFKTENDTFEKVKSICILDFAASPRFIIEKNGMLKVLWMNGEKWIGPNQRTLEIKNADNWSPNVWNKVIFAWDEEGHYLSLNKELKTSDSDGNGVLLGFHHLTLGASWNKKFNAPFFKGGIDELRISSINRNTYIEPEETSQSVRILLMGDSTVIGSIPRTLYPQYDTLEQVIEKLVNYPKNNLPKVKAINRGQNGDYIKRLLETRYEKEIGSYVSFDYIFVRYGINDACYKPFAETYEKYYLQLIAKLKKDFPKAKIILETIIPYNNVNLTKITNDIIRKTAAKEGLAVLDTHKRFDDAMKKCGPDTYHYRRVTSINDVPEQYRGLIPADAFSKDGKSFCIMDNYLDIHFGKLIPHWYDDHHPNAAGYQVIGSGIAEFLVEDMKKTQAKK